MDSHLFFLKKILNFFLPSFCLPREFLEIFSKSGKRAGRVLRGGSGRGSARSPRDELDFFLPGVGLGDREPGLFAWGLSGGQVCRDVTFSYRS